MDMWGETKGAPRLCVCVYACDDAEMKQIGVDRSAAHHIQMHINMDFIKFKSTDYGLQTI